MKIQSELTGNSKRLRIGLIVTKIDGKEITLTLEDALLSPESMRIMMGGAIRQATSDEKVKVHVTSRLYKVADFNSASQVEDTYGNMYDKPTKFKAIDMTTGARYDEECIKGTVEGIKKPDDKDEIRVFFEAEMDGEAGNAFEITISPETFPGTYYFVGDTLLRSEVSGEDEPYQWVLPKGKISSEITFTMEADGDPATFEFTVNALRAKNEQGKYEMMKFVKYNFNQTAGDKGAHATHGEEHING